MAQRVRFLVYLVALLLAAATPVLGILLLAVLLPFLSFLAFVLIAPILRSSDTGSAPEFPFLSVVGCRAPPSLSIA